MATNSEIRGMIRTYEDCLSHISPEYPLHHYISRKIKGLIERAEDAESYWP
jgi:hypothetical protein